MPSALNHGGPSHPTLQLSYEERASLPNTSPLAAYVFRLCSAKKTNLCVSADVTSTAELLQLAEEVGDSICILKTHADIIQDFSHRTMAGLQRIARKRGFLVFEDRKFGDIGSTVQKQYTAGPLQIVRWANIVNAHIFPGPAIITALSSAATDAVLAYNTSVETSITGPPDYMYESGNEQEEEEEEEVETPGQELSERQIYSTDGQDGDRLSSGSDSDQDDDDHKLSEAELRRKLSGDSLTFPERAGRKLSVVSVSTTISTKTESISPQPTPVTYRSMPLPTSFSNFQVADKNEADVATALEELGGPPMARALLLLAEMSSAGNLLNAAYTSECVVQARKNPEFVMGFIAQQCLNSAPRDNFITMTPGVQIGSTGDGLGQQYNTPEKVIKGAGVDIIIVGRGVYSADDRKAAAEEYRIRGWKAYEERVSRKGR